MIYWLLIVVSEESQICWVFYILYKLGKYENIAIAAYIIEMVITLKLLYGEQKRLIFQNRMIKKEAYFSLSVDKGLWDLSL